MKVEVKNMPGIYVAAVSHIGPYKGDSELFKGLFDKLVRWAAPKDLINTNTIFLSVYFDDQGVDEKDRITVRVCMRVPENIKGEGDVNIMTLPGGKYAIANFELDADEYEKVWDSLYSKWLPESGYRRDVRRPSMEIYKNDPEKHPQKKHIVDICIPVKAAQ